MEMFQIRILIAAIALAKLATTNGTRNLYG
jgi:hypothetical protein